MRRYDRPGTLAQIDVLILCGGLGTRLRPVVSDRPKGLAVVAGRPFLDILVDELLGKGLRRFVFCTGHGADQIAVHYCGRNDAEFVFSPESSPLGTAGAVRNALAHIRSDPFFVVNGDSICEVEYSELLAFHQRRHSSLTIVVTPASERTDVGLVALGESDHILSFDEKHGSCKDRVCYVNAGIYVMHRSLVVSLKAAVQLSLEKDVFPGVARDGQCYGYRASGTLTDIGTPERYLAAQDTMRDS